MDPYSREHLIFEHQLELRRQAEERRRSLRLADRRPLRACLGDLLVALGSALTRLGQGNLLHGPGTGRHTQPPPAFSTPPCARPGSAPILAICAGRGSPVRCLEPHREV